MSTDSTDRVTRKKNAAGASVRKEAGDGAVSEITVDSVRTTVAPKPQTDTNENLYLIGRPTLKQFLRFVKDNAVHPPSSSELIEEWQAANRIVRALDKGEAGIADKPSIQPVDPENKLLLEFLQAPLVRHIFNTVPTEVAYIGFGRMVLH